MVIQPSNYPHDYQPARQLGSQHSTRAWLLVANPVDSLEHVPQRVLPVGLPACLLAFPLLTQSLTACLGVYPKQQWQWQWLPRAGRLFGRVVK